jgi:hypothetical protein
MMINMVKKFGQIKILEIAVGVFIGNVGTLVLLWACIAVASRVLDLD